MRLLLLLAVPFVAMASPQKPTLRYQPQPDDERPMPVSVTVNPKESYLSVRVVFSQIPWGDACKLRCANTTLFLDTDANRTTGLQMGTAAETGADIAVTFLGTREYKEVSAETSFRAKLRQFMTSHTRPDEGGTFLELDRGRDADRLKVEDKTVTLMVDLAQVGAPAGRRIRVVFHPVGSAAIQGESPGMLSGLRDKAAISDGSDDRKRRPAKRR